MSLANYEPLSRISAGDSTSDDRTGAEDHVLAGDVGAEHHLLLLHLRHGWHPRRLEGTSRLVFPCVVSHIMLFVDTLFYYVFESYLCCGR